MISSHGDVVLVGPGPGPVFSEDCNAFCCTPRLLGSKSLLFRATVLSWLESRVAHHSSRVHAESSQTPSSFSLLGNCKWMRPRVVSIAQGRRNDLRDTTFSESHYGQLRLPGLHVQTAAPSQHIQFQERRRLGVYTTTRRLGRPCLFLASWAH